MQPPIDPTHAASTSFVRDDADADAALLGLPLDTLEEAAGELVRRITVAMRDIGELRADEPDGERRTPRQRVAALIALTEAAVQQLSAAGDAPARPAESRASGDLLDRPSTTATAAVMYGAPTLGGLLQRLEQDRRMLTSVARHLEGALDEPGNGVRLRRMLTDAAIVGPAACARALELLLAQWDEAERDRFEAERDRDI